MFTNDSQMALSLKNIQLENFKCFKKAINIELGKINIITGANSSGKSSLLHGMLSPFQSEGFPFSFSTNGKFVNMGDFKEMSNKHNKNNSIKVGMTLASDKSEYIITSTWNNNTYNNQPELKSLNIVTAFLKTSLRKKYNYYVLDFKYEPTKDPNATPKEQELFKAYMWHNFINSRKTVKQAFKTAASKKRNESLFLKYVATYFGACDFKNFKINDLENLSKYLDKKSNFRLTMTFNTLIPTVFKNFGNQINAISSFRLHPDRTYLEKSKDRDKVGKFGEGYLDQIVLWEKNNSPKFNELISFAKELSLFTFLKSNRLGGGRFEFLLKTKRGGIKTSLVDVGFGISQFLPIMVADLQLGDNSTLFVAEPEIHLHPNVQARFGDFLINQINKKKKNYVIETHSEYLLNRIRLAIVKGNLKESDLKVYYLENSGVDVEIHKILFGKKGQIEGAPKSFFDTYLMDLKDIALSIP